jgi:hypothetical protein
MSRKAIQSKRNATSVWHNLAAKCKSQELSLTVFTTIIPVQQSKIRRKAEKSPFTSSELYQLYFLPVVTLGFVFTSESCTSRMKSPKLQKQAPYQPNLAQDKF